MRALACRNSRRAVSCSADRSGAAHGFFSFGAFSLAGRLPGCGLLTAGGGLIGLGGGVSASPGEERLSAIGSVAISVARCGWGSAHRRRTRIGAATSAGASRRSAGLRTHAWRPAATHPQQNSVAELQSCGGS